MVCNRYPGEILTARTRVLSQTSYLIREGMVKVRWRIRVEVELPGRFDRNCNAGKATLALVTRWSTL